MIKPIDYSAPNHSEKSSESTNPPINESSSRPLLLIQGPLALDWKRRKWGILPRLENAEISGVNPPTPPRIDLWAKQHIHVLGRPDWIFVKVHTHGCVRGAREILFGDAMRYAHEHLSLHYGDGDAWRLHYVTAREMVNIVRAAEAGEAGDPGEYRDYDIGRPPCVAL